MVAGTRMMDATNESVVHTAHIAKIRHFNIYVDDQLAMDVRADVESFPTATGSTCYAMAVGSPVIDPNNERVRHRPDGTVQVRRAPHSGPG